MHVFSRSIVLLPLLVLGVAPLLSCSPPRGHVGADSAAETVVRDIILERHENERAIKRGSEAIVRECMRKRGYRYTPQKYYYTMPGLLWTTTTPDIARTKGFGLQSVLLTSEPDAPEIRELSKDEGVKWRIALIGRPISPDDSQGVTTVDLSQGSMSFRPDSCSSIGLSNVVGNLPEWHATMDGQADVMEKFTEKLEKDSRYVESLVRWRSCMQAHEYLFRAPFDAVLEARNAYVSPLKNGHIQAFSYERGRVPNGAVCKRSGHAPGIR